MTRIELLTGAPTKEAVRDSTRNPVNNLLPRFRRYFADDDSGGAEENSLKSPLSTGDTPFSYAKWRVVPLKRSWEESLTKDWRPRQFVGQHSGLGSINPEEDPATDFLRHSFLAYSQAETDNHLDENTMSSCDFSFTTESLENSSMDSLAALPQEFTIPTISSIKSLPSSECILATAPRLLKVNLLVGVISALPARTVTLQRTKEVMNIFELLVGDDTSAGFSINFWTAPNGDAREFVKVLPSIRSRDIVLVRNVALGTYQGQVYGQTLNPRWSRTETTIEVIGKDGLVVGKALGGAQGKNKLERVINWVSTYLWRPAGSHARKDLDELPPDSIPRRY
jgi:hypothetical protein